MITASRIGSRAAWPTTNNRSVQARRQLSGSRTLTNAPVGFALAEGAYHNRHAFVHPTPRCRGRTQLVGALEKLGVRAAGPRS